jgi:uncharacterized protein
MSVFKNIFPVINKGKQFALIAFANEHPTYVQKQINKIIWHTIFNYNKAKEWYALLNSPILTPIVLYRPRLYVKPFRVYLSTKWAIAQRIKVINDTYRFLKEKHIMHLIKEGSTTIANFVLKDESIGIITIGYDEKFRKEGELVIEFHHQQLGNIITAASFSVEQLNEKWVCRIGCIQGEKNTQDNAIKNLQNAMHGLRPKVLTIFIIQQLCNALQIEAIYGAGDAIQAFRKKHAIHLPWLHKIGFNYDKIWQEEGGVVGKDGWFLLPIIPKRKPIAEVKTHKRAYYNRRYALEEMIGEEVSKFVISQKNKQVPA